MIPFTSDDRDTTMLVSPFDPAVPATGGRALLSRTNREALHDILGDRLLFFQLTASRHSGVLAALNGHIDGVFLESLKALRDAIRINAVTQIFLDGSNLGAAARAIRAESPDVRIVTFMHNVEARFFFGLLQARPSPRALAVLFANLMAERAAVRSSDVVIALSDRDGAMLRRLYGRSADVVLPLVMTDRSPAPPRASTDDSRFILFVGGAFYANRDAVLWFAREVAPRISVEAVVIGHGMDDLRPLIAGAGNVRIVGSVDDLSGWYRDAHVVIAPVFDGSGMKTKVAEALMFGKRVIGTPEAFSGYDPAVVATGWVADDADGFVAAIQKAVTRDLPGFDPALRMLFDRFNGSAEARARLAAVVGTDESSSRRA